MPVAARLKVLIVASWYPNVDHAASGAFIRDQVLALAEFVDVAVLYTREAPVELEPVVTYEEGIPVVRAQLGMPRPTRAILGRVRAVAKNLHNKLVRYPRVGLASYELLTSTWGSPDILHVQALWPAALIARQVARRYGVPYVVTEHSEEYLAQSERRLVKTPGVLRLILRPLAGRAARTIAVSQYLADRLIDLGLAVRPEIVPNVVQVSPAAPMPTKMPRAIAHVSVMSPAKNLGALLIAVDRLRAHRQDFVLRLVGDGDFRPRIQDVANELHLAETVEFTGYMDLDGIHAILAESAFTIVSSTHETFSVVAADSLMCGRPVLSTRCGGPEEFITPAVGRLIQADSIDALVDGLDWMLDHYSDFDPQALHEYARARFAPDVVAGRIVRIYLEVLGV